MIQADMTIMEAMKSNPKAGEILSQFGMHCTGCAIARGETIKEAAMAHGIDLSELLGALNK